MGYEIMETNAKEKIRIYTLTPKRKTTTWYEYDIMISSEDSDLLEDYHWSTSNRDDTNRRYFICTINGKNVNLHQVIAQREYPYNDVGDFIVDFCNGNTFDLRRSNLRLTDRRGDSLNRSCQSKYCGVYKTVHNNYVAANYIGGWNYIGKYDTEIEAAIAWGIYNGFDGPQIRERYK